VEKGFAEVLDRDPRKTHPYRAGLLARQAMRFSASELRRCEEEIQEANEKLVSSGVSSRAILELMLIRMLRRGEGGRRTVREV